MEQPTIDVARLTVTLATALMDEDVRLPPGDIARVGRRLADLLAEQGWALVDELAAAADRSPPTQTPMEDNEP